VGTLIDSSILIAAQRGHLDLDAALAARREEQFRVAAITVAELYEGVERADSPARAEKRRLLVEDYLTRLPVVDFDAAIAREHARMRVRLMPVGKTVPFTTCRSRSRRWSWDSRSPPATCGAFQGSRASSSRSGESSRTGFLGSSGNTAHWDPPRPFDR
jgi:tRNA(fMet)-specific endonuclease VapC